METKIFKKKADGIVTGKVEAVPLRSPNFPAEVAAWCGGKVGANHFTGQPVHIEFGKDNIGNFGEWMVKTEHGFMSVTEDFLLQEYEPSELSYGESLLNVFGLGFKEDNQYVYQSIDRNRNMADFVDSLFALSTEPTCTNEIKQEATEAIELIRQAKEKADRVYSHFLAL